MKRLSLEPHSVSASIVRTLLIVINRRRDQSSCSLSLVSAGLIQASLSLKNATAPSGALLPPVPTRFGLLPGHTGVVRPYTSITTIRCRCAGQVLMMSSKASYSSIHASKQRELTARPRVKILTLEQHISAVFFHAENVHASGRYSPRVVLKQNIGLTGRSRVRRHNFTPLHVGGPEH